VQKHTVLLCILNEFIQFSSAYSAKAHGLFHKFRNVHNENLFKDMTHSEFLVKYTVSFSNSAKANNSVLHASEGVEFHSAYLAKVTKYI
jgi:hypothetical protein